MEKLALGLSILCLLFIMLFYAMQYTINLLINNNSNNRRLISRVRNIYSKIFNKGGFQNEDNLKNAV